MHGILADEAVRFDVHGADAWTFTKPISGTVTAESCDAVLVDSARGRVVAQMAEGRFTATVPLAQGRNSITAFCVRHGKRVGKAAQQIWTVRLADVPTAHVVVRVSGGDVLLDASGSTEAAGIKAPLVRYRWDAATTNPTRLESVSGSNALTPIARARGPLLRLSTPAFDGDYRVSLTVTDADGRSDRSTALFRVVSGKAAPVDELREHPDWRACTVLYGVAPALFGTDGLASVTQHLDQIARLGATALWLAPVTGAPPGDFGYALTDPFRLRRDLGPPAALRALITRAHALHMHVLLDFVTNHLAADHPYFADAARFGHHSPYYAWFERNAAGQPRHYFDWVNLENLNYGNREVRNYMMAAITHWVRDFAIDGFRADAAWAVRQRDPDFWPLLRQEVERIRPDTLLLAEASARDPYYETHGFDAAYDWTGELGHWAWEGIFAAPGAPPDLHRLRARLTNDGHGFSDGSGVLHFLNNNDTGQRFVVTHGLATTRLAAVLLFTVPGIPLVYAGDEVGASFEPYNHPAPIRWTDPDYLLPLYSRLIKLRHDIPALTSPALRMLFTQRDDSVLAYVRGGRGPEEDVTVVINFGAASFTLPLTLIGSDASTRSWWAENPLDGTHSVLPVNAQTVRVAPHSALLLRRAVDAASIKDLCSTSRD